MGPTIPCVIWLWPTSPGSAQTLFPLVSILYCHAANCPKVKCLKMVSVYHLTVSHIAQPGSSAWNSCEVGSQEVIRGCSYLRLDWKWGIFSNGADSHTWQGQARCWGKLSVLLYVVLSTGLLECPHDMALGIPETEWSKKGISTNCNIFMTWPWISHTVIFKIS